jgi:hypothetical protein
MNPSVKPDERKTFALKFRTREQRDTLARRLSDLAIAMIRADDQGGDGRIWASDEAIGDLRTAAYVVGMMPLLADDE